MVVDAWTMMKMISLLLYPNDSVTVLFAIGNIILHLVVKDLHTVPET